MFTRIKQEFQSKINKMIAIGSKEPVVCPCCEHKHKLYKRSINKAMAKSLAIAYSIKGREPFHAYNLLTPLNAYSGDFAKLKFWWLVEPVANKEGFGGKTNGYWRITSFGERYLKSEMPMDQYSHILNDEVVGKSGDKLYFNDSFKDKFDFSEFMSREGV